MNTRTLSLVFALLVSSACSEEQLTAPDVDAQFSANGTSYWVAEAIPLPVASGGQAEPRAINSSGQIVGWATYPGSSQKAALWDNANNVSYISLHLAEWEYSSAEDINDLGHVVGWYMIEDGCYQVPPGVTCTPHLHKYAFLWRDGAYELLGGRILREDGHPAASQAFAINESGEVVGAATIKGHWEAVRWHTTSHPSYEFIGTGDPSFATDVNESFAASGLVPPWSRNAGTSVFYDKGTTEWLMGDGICHDSQGASVHQRVAINNNNWIVGSHKAQGVCRAVRFQSAGPPSLLGGTSTTHGSHASDLNDSGVAVGFNNDLPTYWPPSGDAATLFIPGALFTDGRATGINENLEIVGWVRAGYSKRFPYLWRLRKAARGSR